MEKVEVTIKYNNNSKHVSLIFYVEDAKNAKAFFEVLAAQLSDRSIDTRILPTEDENDRMKTLAGIK
jgi:hypothetical protein